MERYAEQPFNLRQRYSYRQIAAKCDCNSPNLIYRSIGKLLSQCFVGDTAVLIAELEHGQSVAIVDAEGTASDLSSLIVGSSCIVVGVVKLGREVRRNRKRRDAEEPDWLFEPEELPDFFNRIDGGEGVRRPTIARSRCS